MDATPPWCRGDLPRDVSLSFFGEEKERLVRLDDTLEGLKVELLQGLEELVAPVERGRFRDAEGLGGRPDRHLREHPLDEGAHFSGYHVRPSGD